jgi:hypothetical protein
MHCCIARGSRAFKLAESLEFHAWACRFQMQGALPRWRSRRFMALLASLPEVGQLRDVV